MSVALPRLAGRRLLGATLATSLGYFLLGYGVTATMPPVNLATVIWPATAFAACMILHQARGWRERLAMLAAVFLADLLNNMLHGGTALVLLGYSLCNTAELALAVAVAGPRSSLRSAAIPQQIMLVLRVCFAAPLAGGAASMLVAWANGDPDFFIGGLHWFFADVLGFVMVFPAGMAISRRQIHKLHLGERLPLAAFTTLLVVGVTALVFKLHAYAQQFQILPAALVMTRWFRMLGAGAAVVLIAAVIMSGGAPAVTHPAAITLIQYGQLFLAVCALLCVRVAALLNERDLHLAIIERRHRRAVRASRFKSRLLAHVSHEVRSPLSAIIGFSSLLEAGAMPAERAAEFAAIIGHNGELLQRLHDDLLDMSRAEAGKLSLHPARVAVGRTLQACVSGLRLDASLGGKDVVIEGVEDTLALVADPVRLAQILNNLIANAFKYGDNHSPIRLRARALEDGFARIEIVNAGPGIPASEHAAVFLPFRRGAGREVPGAGLGLSIAKLLVEAQGGRIDFESIPGRQTRFWIDLPLAA
jgi:signal transduction histidine kinase